MSEARIVVGVPKRGAHERVVLYCPTGHEVVSAPTSTRTGRQLVEGDFSGEWCGHGRCGWTGSAESAPVVTPAGGAE